MEEEVNKTEHKGKHYVFYVFSLLSQKKHIELFSTLLCNGEEFK